MNRDGLVPGLFLRGLHAGQHHVFDARPEGCPVVLSPVETAGVMVFAVGAYALLSWMIFGGSDGDGL